MSDSVPLTINRDGTPYVSDTVPQSYVHYEQAEDRYYVMNEEPPKINTLLTDVLGPADSKAEVLKALVDKKDSPIVPVVVDETRWKELDRDLTFTSWYSGSVRRHVVCDD